MIWNPSGPCIAFSAREKDPHSFYISWWDPWASRLQWAILLWLWKHKAGILQLVFRIQYEDTITPEACYWVWSLAPLNPQRPCKWWKCFVCICTAGPQVPLARTFQSLLRMEWGAVRPCLLLSFNSCVVDFTYQHVAASCSLCGRRGWCLLWRRGQAETYVHWCGQCLSQKLGYIAWCWTSPAEFLSGVFRTRLNCWRQELALPLPNVAMQAHC